MKRKLLATLLAVCMLVGTPPAGALAADDESPAPDASENVIYVSQDGSGDADGTSKEKATTLNHATELANEKGEPVQIVVVDMVVVDQWETPTVDTVVLGEGDHAGLKFEYKSALGNDPMANIDMQGDCTFDNLKFDVNYKNEFSRQYGTYTIVANGNNLKIGRDVQYIYPANQEGNKDVSRCHVIGGSLGQDLTHSTHVEIYASLPNCYVVGGCVSGDLTGDTYVHIEDATVQRVIGGGATWKTGQSANVNGNTEVIVKSSRVVNWILGGGHTGDNGYGNANVSYNTNVTVENSKSTSTQVYGGGMATQANVTATIGENVTIFSKDNDMSANEGTVYGGGSGATGNMDNAKVNGNVSIQVEDGYSFGYVYGGGKNANVGGDVNIVVSGENKMDSPSIYGGGESDTPNNPTHVSGDVDITLKGVNSSVCSLGKYGAVDKKVTIHLQGGGGQVKDTVFTENILNADASHINWAGNVTGNPIYHENTEVIVSDGTFVATTIYGAPQITIKDGGVLQEQREYSSKNNKTLFKDVKNVTIEPGGTLSLLQTNEISGTFNGAGTLKMPQAAELIADGAVTVSGGAMFVPTDGYKEGDVFLQSKEAFEQGEQPDFDVDEAGSAEGYFTDNRVAESNANGIQHEWFVAKKAEPFTLQPLELTKYVADGDHNAGDSHDNCFPEPRYTTEFDLSDVKVDGQSVTEWPFGIQYFKEGTNIPIENDHAAGTYIARVVFNDGIDQNQVTIKDRPVALAESKLHIRGVSSVGAMDNIDNLASKVTETAPAENVSDATAVMSGGMTYLVNNVEGQGLSENPDVRLLHDELLTNSGNSDPFMEILQQRLEGTLEGADPSDVKVEANANRQYAMKYLDLIDANDSNLLICAQEEYDIYLPYPEGTDKNTKFDLYRFNDLNRTYTDADSGENVMDNIRKTTIRQVEIENTDAGIRFTVPKPSEWVTASNYSIGALALTWLKDDGGEIIPPPVSNKVTLHYESNGGTKYDDERYKRGTVVNLDKVPERNGYTFTGWYADEDLTERIDEIKMTSNKTVYAGWEKTELPDDLNTVDHFSYVVGYAEDYHTGETTTDQDLWPVKPQNNITRAEVATIFYRLLEDEVRDKYDTTVNDFNDVDADDWFNQTVSTLASMGVVRGYDNGSFRPNAPITRAEFGAIATRFFEKTGATYEPGTFVDVTGDEWFADAIQDAADLGLIGGYPDGTVRPGNSITRAEACAIVNRTIGRVPHVDHLLAEDVMKTWPDNKKTDWYYADMQEATNGHDYEWVTEKGTKVENWTKLLDKDWNDR